MKFRTQALSAVVIGGVLWAGTAVAQSTPQPGTTQSSDPAQSSTTPQSQDATQPGTTPTQEATQGASTTTADTSARAGSQGQVLIDPGLIYNDKTPARWVNKPVTLKNVMVQDTNDDGNFWVGSDGHHRLLIVKASDPTLTAMKFHKGDIVTVSGTVKAAGDYALPQTHSEKGSMVDAKNSSGVFLMANQISIGSSTQH